MITIGLSFLINKESRLRSENVIYDCDCVYYIDTYVGYREEEVGIVDLVYVVSNLSFTKSFIPC